VLRAALLAAVLVLAGCGARHASLADCLNAKGFLVEGNATVVRGSSAGGVSFTLTVYATTAAASHALAAKPGASAARVGSAVVDFSGNPPARPGGPPAKLSKRALTAIHSCLDRP